MKVIDKTSAEDLKTDATLLSVGVKSVFLDDTETTVVVDPFVEEQKLVVSDKFLRVYNIVRPILSMVSTFPFFPPKWRAVVAVFIQAVDQLVMIPPIASLSNAPSGYVGDPEPEEVVSLVKSPDGSE